MTVFRIDVLGEYLYFCLKFMELFAFPVSAILAFVTVLLVALSGKGRLAAYFKSRWTAVALLGIAAILMVIEGSWAPGIPKSGSFAFFVILLVLSLGFSATADLKRKCPTAFLSHLGLFLVLAAGLFGAPDRLELGLKLHEGESGHIAYEADGLAFGLPFELKLNEFEIDYHEDGVSPKQYRSRISIDGKNLETSVNHPARHGMWRIYQAGFGQDAAQYAVLKIVRDPWLPVIALGGLLLAAGAFLQLSCRRPVRITRQSSGMQEPVRDAAGIKAIQGWKGAALTAAVAVVFAFLSLARIRFATLMPALRSFWFVPHLLIYMLAYSLLALSLLALLSRPLLKRIPEELPRRLLSAASSLLLLGMLCGAVWAQAAWGNYWTWDAKECWAAATWMISLAGLHARGKGRRTVLTAAVLLAFAAMQMSWYGVNHLPAAKQSLHTYNQG